MSTLTPQFHALTPIGNKSDNRQAASPSVTQSGIQRSRKSETPTKRHTKQKVQNEKKKKSSQTRFNTMSLYTTRVQATSSGCLWRSPTKARLSHSHSAMEIASHGLDAPFVTPLTRGPFELLTRASTSIRQMGGVPLRSLPGTQQETKQTQNAIPQKGTLFVHPRMCI